MATKFERILWVGIFLVGFSLLSYIGITVIQIIHGR